MGLKGDKGDMGLKTGMKYFIRSEGLVHPMQLIENQKDNILTLKEGTEIDFLTIHII